MHRLFILAVFLCHLSVFGQQEGIQRFRLGAGDLVHDSASADPGISTASRSLKYLSDLPVTAYVVTRSDILENGYITLVDVLKDVPGIKVSQPGSGIEGETFLMNGLYGNYYCKVLVNGIPVTPSVASGTAVAGHLPVRQAERIEIISGPSAALYGSDAIAGVVNIITRKSDRPVWTQADLSVGSQANYNMNVMIGGKFGKDKNVAEYNLYGNYGQQGDMNVKYDIPGNYDPTLYDEDAPSGPYYRGTPNSPEFDRLPLSSSLLGFGITYRGLSAHYDHMERRSHSSIGQNTANYAYYDPAVYWGEQMDRLTLSYENTWNRFTSATQFSFLAYRLDENTAFRMISERGDNGKVYKYMASDDIFFDEILTFAVNRDLELSGGLSLQASGNLPLTNDLAMPFDTDKYRPFSETVEVTDTLMGSFGINPTNFYNVAGYLQAYYSIGKLRLLAGARWDQHSLFGRNLSPKVGAVYRLSRKLSFRTNYGHGFRAPSLFYVYKSLAYPVTTGDRIEIAYENLPNPDVGPERFRAFEFGVRYDLDKKVSLEFVFLYHKMIENISYSLTFIDSTTYPAPNNFLALSAKNDDNSMAELFLGQVNLRVKDLVPSLALGSDLYVTYTSGKEVLPNNFGTLQDYRNMPDWFIQWNLDLMPARKWTLIIHQVFSSSWKKRFIPLPVEQLTGLIPIETDGYYTLDMTNRFSINRNFHAFLIVNNVFNARYGGIDAYGGALDLIYNPQFGRNFRLGFSFTME